MSKELKTRRRAPCAALRDELLRMISAEGSLWLRNFLVRAGISEREAARFSSHSLKAMLLDWRALHGSLSMDERRAMGHFDSRLAVRTLRIFSATYIANCLSHS